MRALHRHTIVLWVIAAVIFALVAVHGHQTWLDRGDPAVISGYVLFFVLLGLGLYNMRKKLSMVPLGRAAHWSMFHSVGGVLALALFWLHTQGTVWPTGSYEQALTALFYIVSLSGLVGFVVQRVYPRRLTETGVEVIYERIPAEIADIRARVEALLLEATEKTGAGTLARHYLETLAWYFQRPRFFWSHVFGGKRGPQWIERELRIVDRYLAETEGAYLDEIGKLADLKNRIDFHYAVQSVAKLWLFFHVPTAAATVVVAVWHLVLVHVYVL